MFVFWYVCVCGGGTLDVFVFAEAEAHDLAVGFFLYSWNIINNWNMNLLWLLLYYCEEM
jgi:hypothetical protein